MEARVRHLEKAMETLERVERSQQVILAELSRYRGAWGALVLVVSAVGAALYILKDWIAGGFK